MESELTRSLFELKHLCRRKVVSAFLHDALAFSSEADTALRKGKASNQQDRAFRRFSEMSKCSGGFQVVTEPIRTNDCLANYLIRRQSFKARPATGRPHRP
jgi:hypothetical protein